MITRSGPTRGSFFSFTAAKSFDTNIANSDNFILNTKMFNRSFYSALVSAAGRGLIERRSFLFLTTGEEYEEPKYAPETE